MRRTLGVIATLALGTAVGVGVERVLTADACRDLGGRVQDGLCVGLDG